MIGPDMYTLHRRSRWMMAFILSLSFTVSAQWVPTNGRRRRNGICAGHGRTDLYAGVMIAGVFRSTDDGANWTNSSSGLTNLFIQSLAIFGSDVYAGTEGSGVFRSTDQGAHWTAANSGSPAATSGRS